MRLPCAYACLVCAVGLVRLRQPCATRPCSRAQGVCCCCGIHGRVLCGMSQAARMDAKQTPASAHALATGFAACAAMPKKTTPQQPQTAPSMPCPLPDHVQQPSPPIFSAMQHRPLISTRRMLASGQDTVQLFSLFAAPLLRAGRAGTQALPRKKPCHASSAVPPAAWKYAVALLCFGQRAQTSCCFLFFPCQRASPPCQLPP